MLKKYSTWIAIISFVMVIVMAIFKKHIDVPHDNVFVLTEWLLYVTSVVSIIFCIKEANK